MGREGVNNNNVAEVKNLAMELDVARLAGFALSLPCFAFFCYFFCWSLWGAQLKPCWTCSQVASHGAAPSIPVPQRAACERRTWGTTSFSWDPPPSLTAGKGPAKGDGWWSGSRREACGPRLPAPSPTAALTALPGSAAARHGTASAFAPAGRGGSPSPPQRV